MHYAKVSFPCAIALFKNKDFNKSKANTNIYTIKYTLRNKSKLLHDAAILHFLQEHFKPCHVHKNPARKSPKRFNGLQECAWSDGCTKIQQAHQQSVSMGFKNVSGQKYATFLSLAPTTACLLLYIKPPCLPTQNNCCVGFCLGDM
jgi:hypothetical protein